MPVIINEFELVNEEPSPPTRSGDQAAGEQAPRSPVLRPADVERIVRHFEARRERVRAD
jgi:hypothetical protein